MFEPIRKYAQFSGRARRAEYWMFFLLLIVVEVAFYILLMMTGAGTAAASMAETDMSPLMILVGCAYLVVMLGLLVPSLAVSFRRLHDTNRSAWWLLIGLIPILGGLVLFVFTVLDGTPGDNRFGPDPKGRGAAAA